MVMTALRDGASRGVFKYFLLGILVMAAGGLVFMDIGGFFRGGVTNSDVAKIGAQNLPIAQFDRTLRRTINRLGMTPQQAHQLGYTRELLNGEIRTSLLQQKAANTGIRVSNEQVAQNIKKLIQPMAQPGQAPKDVLEQLLRSQSISEQQLADSIRREMTVNMIGNTIQSGFLTTSDAMARDIALYEQETRDVQYILFKDSDFKNVKEPDETKLREFYESTKEAYAIPEMRKSSLIIIDANALKSSLEISEEEVKEVYERNISAYSEEEKRTIEQVILPGIEQAEQIAKLTQDGKKLIEALKEVTGNTTDLLPATASEKTDLLEELQEPVFTADKAGILGPLESGLGYHIVSIQTITPARIIPLSEVQKDIKDELTETRLIDAQYDLANSVDDYLASGEPLPALEEELGVKAQSFPLSNNFGIGENGKAVFTSALGPDAQSMVAALFNLDEGEASPVTELSDGRMAAIVVEEIKAKTYKPFEDLESDLKKSWMSDSRRIENKMFVLETLSNAKNDSATLNAVAKANGKTIQSLNALKRGSEAKAPIPTSAIQNIFIAGEKELFTMDTENGAAIAIVQKSKIPEKISAETLKTTRNTLQDALQNEAYTLYIGKLHNDYGVTINDRLLETVYAPQDAE